MTRETIKEYILQVKSQDGTEALYNRWEPDILVEVINEILNDHETAIEILMKANEEEISRHFNEVKANDEITQDIKEAYELKSIAYDLLLEAIQLKDEEIERLKAELLICKKRYTQKAVEGKELKKTLSIAWRKQLKAQR